MDSTTREVMFSSASDEWSTPWPVVRFAEGGCPFTFDAACTPDNMRAPLGAVDGLRDPWGLHTWCNPPYSNIDAWVEKAIHEVELGNTCETAVLLVPARTDTRWFSKAFHRANQVVFFKGRIKFGDGKNSAPFPSVLFTLRAYQGPPDYVSRLPIVSIVPVPR